MSKITYYKGNQIFVCECGHAWYAAKSYPEDYSRGRTNCHGCYSNCKANIVDEFADVEVKPKCMFPFQKYNEKPVYAAEVFCKRCEEWFPITANVRKRAICPKCDMPISMRLVGDKRIREMQR